MKLLDYIRGTRKGKEVHRLQKEAMRDPFLADAMDAVSYTHLDVYKRQVRILCVENGPNILKR